MSIVIAAIAVLFGGLVADLLLLGVLGQVTATLVLLAVLGITVGRFLD
jgi:hypothetical protein